MQKSQLSVFRFLFAVSDIILLNACLFFSYYIANRYGKVINSNIYFYCSIANTIVWIFCTNLFRLYNEYTLYQLKSIYGSSWRSILLHGGLFSVYIFLIDSSNFPPSFILPYYSLVTVAFLLSRFSFIAFKKTIKGVIRLNFNNRKGRILAIASVGGHWIELLRFMPLFKENQVTFVSNKEDLKGTVEGYNFFTVPDANRKNKVDLLRSASSVFVYILIVRPQVVITTGAAPGLAGIFIGKLFGAKTIWIDSIANAEKLSLSGYIALKFADRVYTQWEHLAAPKIIYSGNVF